MFDATTAETVDAATDYVASKKILPVLAVAAATTLVAYGVKRKFFTKPVIVVAETVETVESQNVKIVRPEAR